MTDDQFERLKLEQENTMLREIIQIHDSNLEDIKKLKSYKFGNFVKKKELGALVSNTEALVNYKKVRAYVG